MDTASNARLQAVCPQLAAKVLQVDAEFQRQNPGDCLEVVQGVRSYSYQLQLWMQGRDGNGNVVDPGKVVTNAPPGHSWHEFGMAVDVVPKSLLMLPDWNPASPLWAKITAIAESLGLVCGACWMHKDLPHLQLTGRFPVSPDDEVRQIFKNGGTAAVWQESGVATAQ